MTKSLGVLLAIVMVCVVGCQTARQTTKSEQQESLESLSTVAEAISGKQVSEQDLKDLRYKIQTDEEAKEAVESIKNALTGTNTTVKYCPITGKRYAPHISVCPEHNVELKILEE